MRQRTYLYIFFTILAFCLIAFSGIQSAGAQSIAKELLEDTPRKETPPPQTQTPPAPKNDLDDVPDEYIEEAINYNKYCHSTSLSRHQNCECLAARYLDKRIEIGPEADRSSIMLAIEGKCPDATEAAGHHYNRCISNATIMPPKIPIEEFCECFANTYAKLFERYELKPNSRTFVSLQTQAMVTCRNPEMAKKLYPYQPR